MRSKKLDIREVCKQIKFGAKRYKNNIIDVYGKKIYVRGGKDQRDASIKNMLEAQSGIDYIVVRHDDDCWYAFKKDVSKNNNGKKKNVVEYYVEDIFTRNKATITIKLLDKNRYNYIYETLDKDKNRGLNKYKDDEYVENGGIPKELLVLLKINLIIDIIKDKISSYRIISENIYNKLTG